MRGAILPLPNTPSWSGAQLKHRDNFTFTLVMILFLTTATFVGGVLSSTSVSTVSLT
jgi:hypothetical protein